MLDPPLVYDYRYDDVLCHKRAISTCLCLTKGKALHTVAHTNTPLIESTTHSRSKYPIWEASLTPSRGGLTWSLTEATRKGWWFGCTAGSGLGVQPSCSPSSRN